MLQRSLLACIGLSVLQTASAQVTIYTELPGQPGAATTSSSAAIPFTTGNSAYSQLFLQAPQPPQGLQQTWPVTIQPASNLQNLSIPQKGTFLGFSVELSVVGQVLGLNSSFLQPPFLNYLANIKERAGHGPVVRVGGNTQDQSTMYDNTFPDRLGHPQMVQKWYSEVNGNPTGTPNINFAEELFYTMGNITSLVDVSWFFGLQFDQPTNDSNAMIVAETVQNILGDHLISLQVGNEPDLYGPHGRRPDGYSIQDYFNEFQGYLANFQASPAPQKKIILGPSVCCQWNTQEVLDAGYLQQFGQYLNTIGLMHYPDNNCATPKEDPQTKLSEYLSHNSASNFYQFYQPVIGPAQAAGLPMVLLETNTASCGGFPGLSDSFTAPLWAIDNAFMLATANLSNFMIHVGGQSDSYNPFTPPPTNISKNHGWTTGAVYYAALAVAETFGSSNQSQIIDLQLPSEFRPGYAIYENGAPSRLALFNYASDPSGANDYNAVVQLAGTTVPDHVNVRYLSAPSVVEKFNITWAGQTMGGMFQSDGRLQGKQETITIPCDQTANTCTIPVKAPSFALVFLTDDAMTRSGPPPGSSTLTFATSAYTKPGAHPVMDPSVLATMNGAGGPNGQRVLGTTGKGKVTVPTEKSAAMMIVPAVGSVLALAFGCALALVR